MIKETCLHVMNIFVFVFTRGKSCDKTQLTMVYYLGSFIYELSQNRSKSSKITQNSVKTCLIVFQLEGHYHEDIFGASFGTTFKEATSKSTNHTTNDKKLTNGNKVITNGLTNQGYNLQTNI